MSPVAAPSPIASQTAINVLTALLEGNDRLIGDRIVDALVNQETSFFRDAAVFDVLIEAVALAEAEHRRVRIWCAGCSTGQEPLSLAMIFAERHAASGAPMPEIVATDVSEAAIARCRSARFTQFEIQRGLPVRRMICWFDTTGSDWVAKPELVKLVTFRRMNLVSDQPPPGRFDIILCRNVLLYLSTETKTGVFPKFADALNPGGKLVLGAGETVIGQTSAFEPSREFRGFYQVNTKHPRTRSTK